MLSDRPDVDADEFVPQADPPYGGGEANGDGFVDPPDRGFALARFGNCSETTQHANPALANCLDKAPADLLD